MTVTYGKYIPQKQKLYIEQYEIDEEDSNEKYWTSQNGDCFFQISEENKVFFKSPNYRPYLEVFTAQENSPESYIRVLLSDFLREQGHIILTQPIETDTTEEIEH